MTINVKNLIEKGVYDVERTSFRNKVDLHINFTLFIIFALDMTITNNHTHTLIQLLFLLIHSCSYITQHCFCIPVLDPMFQE